MQREVASGAKTSVMEALQDAKIFSAVERIGWPDAFIEHGSSVSKLREDNGLSAEAILDKVLASYKELEIEVVATEKSR